MIRDKILLESHLVSAKSGCSVDCEKTKSCIMKDFYLGEKNCNSFDSKLQVIIFWFVYMFLISLNNEVEPLSHALLCLGFNGIIIGL